jgi:tetratricopeptide (TPR) repeat protein
MTISGNRRLRRGVVASVLVWSLSVAASATAAGDAPVLVAEGLSKYHRREYAEALALFDEAVTKDPGMMAARHYRGLSRAQLGQTWEAIIDLQVVLLQEPSWIETELELGIVLIDAGRYRQALPHLARAAEKDDLAAAAAFYQGLAHSRLGEMDAARPLFERAAADDELRMPARYHLGAIAYEREEWDSAIDRFTEVSQASPNTEMGRKAADFLRSIRWRSAIPYSLFGSVGFTYDSNVLLAPDDESEKDALGITNQGAGRVDLRAGGAYTPWHSSTGQLSIGYDFSQRLHFDLTEFDLQGHRPTLELSFNYQPVRFGVLASYAYYRLDNDDFLQEGGVLPWVRLFEGGRGWTELSYRFRRADYLQDRFSRLDASSHAVNLRQFVRLAGDAPIPWIGYGFESRDAVRRKGDPFAFDAQQVEAGFSWPRLPLVGAGFDVGYTYRYENYDAASGGRDDNEHGIAVAIAKSIYSHVALRLNYLGTFNDSDIDTFTYNRHVVSLNIEVRL